MAFPVTLNGRTYTLADFEGNNYVDGFPDALEDFVTQAGDIYNSTSTSSVAIGTGSKTFTTADSGKPYQAGTPLRIADAAAPSTNFMDCIVTSYSGTTLVVDVLGTVGSGTKSSWTINIGGTKLASGGAFTGDSLSVSGTVTAGGDLIVDTDTLFVDVSEDAVGINTNAPARALHVNDAMRLEPRATAPSSPSAGDIFFNSTSTTLEFYDGTEWVNAGGGSSFDSLTVTGDLTVDTDTLYVDSTNDRVGVNTTTFETDSALAVQTSASKLDIVNWSVTGAQLKSTASLTFRLGGSGQVFAFFSAGGSELMRILNNNGNVGIGLTNPARKLHVDDVMRLEPRSTAPSSPSAGDIFFNSSTNKLQCYDGTAWQDCF